MIKELCSFFKKSADNAHLDDFHDEGIDEIDQEPSQMGMKHLMDTIKRQAQEIQRLKTEMKNLIEIQNQKAAALEVARQDCRELENQLAEQNPMMKNIMFQEENKMSNQQYTSQQIKPSSQQKQKRDLPVFAENATILQAFLKRDKQSLDALIQNILTTSQQYEDNDLKQFYGIIGSTLFQEMHFFMLLNKFFERLSDDSGTDNFVTTFENHIRNLMSSRRIILWAHVTSAHVIVSRSASMIVPEGEGLLGKALNEGERIIITDPTRDASYSINYDAPLISNARVSLYQPVIDDKGEAIWIIQIIDRLNSKGNIITPSDEDFLILDFLSTSLIKLFKEERHIDEMIKQILTESTKSLLIERQVLPLLETVQQTVTRIVECESLQIFFTDPTNNTIFQLKEGTSNRMTTLNRDNLKIEEAGIAGVAYKTKRVVNVSVAKEHEAYNPTIDGQFPSGAVIAVPLLSSKGGVSLIAVARQKKKGMMFTESDEIILEALSRISQGALTNAQSHERNIAEIDKARTNHKYYTALLTVAQELSAVLDTDTLVRKIMTKAQSFIGADRCSLFLVDKVRGGLWSMVAHGATGKIHIPEGQGVAGHVAATGETLNIPDAYSDPRFNSKVDKSTGYRTRSILCVAIRNGSGGIIGCTQMINKLGAPEFSKTDVDLMTAFNVFCGIALSNAQLFEAATQSKKKMTAMLDIALSLSTSVTLNALVTNIMQRASELIEAEQCLLFIHDGIHQRCRPLNESSENSIEFSVKRDAVGYVAITGTELNVADPSNDKRFDMYYSDLMHITVKNLLVIPVIDASGQIVGVVKAVNKKGMPSFTEEDQSLLRAFASFAGLGLEQFMSKFPEEFGNTEPDIIEQLTPEQLNGVEPCEVLKVDKQVQNLVLTNKFDSLDFTKNDQFRLFIYFLDKFDLPTTFQVSLGTFLDFLKAVYEDYKRIPFHNFNVAIDAAQFLYFEIQNGSLTTIFNKLDLLVLLISGICNDIGHTGHTFGSKAQIPLGILYKEQSVMETFHCGSLIQILSRPQCNIACTLNNENTVTFWTNVIDCILSTDMNQHRKLIEEAEAKFAQNGGSFDLNNQQAKLLLMKFLVKCAVRGRMARVHDLRQPWCTVLCEKAFPNADMNNNDDNSSIIVNETYIQIARRQIEFMQAYDMPLFSILGRIVPALQSLANQVSVNLARWKEIAPDPPEQLVSHRSSK